MRIFYIFLLLIINTIAYCQNYTRDAGVRFGDGIFMSYRQFYSEDMALEAMAGYSQRGFRAVVLREYFQPLSGVRSENLKFIAGYGIHAGIAYTNKFTFLFRTYYHDWKFTPQFGIDGIAGLEYSLTDYPILIRTAIQPYFEYSLNRYFQLKVFNFVVSFNYRF